jgi:hypothetical protein
MSETKKCSKCLKIKPVTEFLWKQKGRRRARCKNCYLTPAKKEMILKSARKQARISYSKKKRLNYHKKLLYLAELKKYIAVNLA